MKFALVLVGCLLGITAAALPASASITYSFSNLEFVNGVDAPLFVSGYFEFQTRSNLPTSNLTSAWSIPTAVDFMVTDNGSFSRSFTDPDYFMYQDGLLFDGTYVVDFGINAKRGVMLDAYVDQLWFAIFQGNVMFGAFSTTDFALGFTSVDSPPTVAELITTVPEPGTLCIFAAGLFFMASAASRFSFSFRCLRSGQDFKPVAAFGAVI